MHVAQRFQQTTVNARARPGIEIAAEHQRRTASGMSKPMRAEKRIGLGLTLMTDEAEVGVDDLDGTVVPLDLGP
jgi:hypothetical protein